MIALVFENVFETYCEFIFFEWKKLASAYTVEISIARAGGRRDKSRGGALMQFPSVSSCRDARYFGAAARLEIIHDYQRLGKNQCRVPARSADTLCFVYPIFFSRDPWELTVCAFNMEITRCVRSCKLRVAKIDFLKTWFQVLIRSLRGKIVLAVCKDEYNFFDKRLFDTWSLRDRQTIWKVI